jgi:stage IV sporulation protein FB
MMPEANLLELRGPFGARLEVRQSAGVLVLFILGFSLFQGGGLAGPVSFLVLLFLSVLLHECGHAWGAHVQGLEVRRIVIHAGGGYCETARGNAQQEEFTVLMGPLSSLALWAGLGLMQVGIYHYVLGNPQWIPLGLALVPALGMAATINLFLFIYNMVPVQPLDGGRLLLLWLRRAMPGRAAMQWAGRVGVLFCILWFPALLWVFVTTGWLLFFAPSLALHLSMARGGGPR